MNKISKKPPNNLLSRLKISSSISSQSNNNHTKTEETSNLKSNNDKKISENYFKRVPNGILLNEGFQSLKEKTPILSDNTHLPKVQSGSLTFNKSNKPLRNSVRSFSANSNGDSQDFLADICKKILTNKIKNIVIMAGAGISCPSGIPDFRSPGTGLYDNLKQYKIPYPEAIFDIDYFSRNPKPFYTIAKELFPSGKYRPNKVHYFFRLLQEKKILHRIYTQNIDGLERLAGVSDANLVEAHGTFATASCIRCGEKYSSTHVKESIDKCEICFCIKCKGIVKPDIIFFGENLPSKFNLYKSDFNQTDLLLIMGTSLEVVPFSDIVDSSKFNVPRILINREAVGVFRSKRRVYDNCILGDIISGVDTIIKKLGWESDLDKIMKEGEEKQINFLSTIPKTKPFSCNRNFSVLIQNNKLPNKHDRPRFRVNSGGGKSKDFSSEYSSSTDTSSTYSSSDS